MHPTEERRTMPRQPVRKFDAGIRRRYEKATPDNLGNLHERMKAVIDRANDIDLPSIDGHLWGFIHDLQLEVSYHKPADPPFGKRTRPLP
jgi:hypothetical protein